MAVKRTFPAKSLETDYSIFLTDFIDLYNREYIKAIKRLLRQANIRNNSRFTLAPGQLKEIREAMKRSRTYKKLLDAIPAVFRGVEEHIVEGLTGLYKNRNFPIPELQLSRPSDSLKKKVAENVELISLIVDKNSERMEQSVIKAIDNGSDFDAIMDEVLKQSTNGKSYARLVAYDQVGKAYAAIASEKQISVGITRYQWTTTNDDRVRDSHRELDGKIFSWDSPPLVDGEYKHPGEPIQCRCIADPVIE